MNGMIRSALPLIGLAIAATAVAGGPGKAEPFVTSMQCKTFAARLTSICKPDREPFGPPACLAQTLQVDASNHGPAVTLFSTRDVRHSPIARYAYHWRCFSAPNSEELLSLDIVGTENSRDEDVWLFDHQGKRLSKRAESRVFRSSDWRRANAGEQLTGQGGVMLPAINE